MRNQMTIAGIAVPAVLLIATCGVVCAMGSKPGADMPTTEHPTVKSAMEKKAAMTQSVYVCPGCHTVALKAGTCGACGSKLVQKHLLGTKDGQAMLCDCPAGCMCDAQGIKDGKCACGKEVTMASCKELYCCPMGCPQLSDKPGQCACGMKLKKGE